MINSSLCYLEKDGKYLMLHRTKKQNDINKDKWLGVGGKLEEKESPEDAIKREVKEETGLTLQSFTMRGIVTYLSNQWETEYMFVFTSTEFTGEVIECNEGDLVWVEKEKVPDLPTWEGDKFILEYLDKKDVFFSMKFIYEDEKLVEYEITEV